MQAFATSFKNGIRAFISFVYPKLQNLIKIKSVDDDLEKYMINLVRETLQYREEHNISRKDLFQLMMQLRNTGVVQKDGVWDTSATTDGR